MADIQINHQQVAQQLLLAVRGIPAQIERYTFIPAAERRRLVLQANIPVRFLNSAAAALDVSPALVGATGVTGDDIRQAIMFRNAFQPLGDELIMVGQGVRHTVTLRLSDAGNVAYQVYAIAKTLNRSADREVLIPHIEDMRRYLGRSGRSEPTVEPEPDQPPQTEPPQPPTGPRK
jgi:hypothetical protein